MSESNTADAMSESVRGDGDDSQRFGNVRADRIAQRGEARMIQLQEDEDRRQEARRHRLSLSAKLDEIIELLSTSALVRGELWNILVGEIERDEFEDMLTFTSAISRRNLCDVLHSGFVMVDGNGRGKSMKAALLACYDATEAPIMTMEQWNAAAKVRAIRNPNGHQATTSPHASASLAGGSGAGGGSGTGGDENMSNDDKKSGQSKEPRAVKSLLPGGGPPDSDDSDSDLSDGGPDRKARKRRIAAYENSLSERMVAPIGETSKAASNFARLYEPLHAKYCAGYNESFDEYESDFILNMQFTGVSSYDAARAIHLTLGGNAKQHFVSQWNESSFATAAEGLARLRFYSQDDSAKERAYEIFYRLSFKAHRHEGKNRTMSEVQVAQSYYSKLLAAKIQLGRAYTDDKHLRDRLMLEFSSYSPILREAFRNNKPLTSQSLLQQVWKRCSYESRTDALPSKEAEVLQTEVDALKADVQGMYLRNQYHESKSNNSSSSRGYSPTSSNGASRSGQQGTKTKGPKAGCWVCGSTEHYAWQKHSTEEVAAPRNKGKSPSVYAANLPAGQSARVLAMEIYDDENASNECDQDAAKDDAEAVAEICEACEISVEEPETNSQLFNSHISACAAEASVLMSVQRSLGLDVHDDLKDVRRNAFDDARGFGGIVININVN